MKKIKLIILLTIPFLFLSSCENDDDGGTINQDQLLGAWYLVDETVDGIPVDIRCDFILDFYRYTVTSFQYYGFNCASLEEYTNDYYLDGYEIVNTGPFETFYVEILSISNSRLVLSRFDEYSVNGQLYFEEVISTYIR